MRCHSCMTQNRNKLRSTLNLPVFCEQTVSLCETLWIRSHVSISSHSFLSILCILGILMCVCTVCVCFCEGRGGQHSAFEGTRSGCSGAGEESQQQSNLRPWSLVLPLQVNPPTREHLTLHRALGLCYKIDTADIMIFIFVTRVSRCVSYCEVLDKTQP